MISLETLREVARLSEGAFLMLAEGLAKKEDADGLAQVFEMIRQDGFPGPLSSHDWNLRVDGDGQARDIRLSRILLQCLENSEIPASLIDDFMQAHVTHGSNAAAVAEIMLFDAASVHRQDVTEKLLSYRNENMGWEQRIIIASSQKILERPHIECLLHGNTEQAIALLKNQPKEVGREMLAHIAAGRLNPNDGGPNVIYPEAEMLLANLTTNTKHVPFGGLPRLLAAFEKHIDDASTAQARFQLLQSYLSNKMGDAWRMDHIETILGGPVDNNALLGRVQEEPQFFAFTTTKNSPFSTLMQTAIQAHCGPIVHEYRAAIAKGLDQNDPFGSIDNLFTVSNQPFHPGHFKATLDVFLKVGHPIHLDRRGSTLFHRLSLSHCDAQDAQPSYENHTLAKLKILLETGANPRTPNRLGNVAGDELDTHDKARWNTIVQSHTARSTAHNLLAEMAEKPSHAP